MTNFNYGRELDLRGYLPEVIRDVEEFKELTHVEESVVRKQWQAAEDCMDDQFIVTSTRSGIERRESMLGITPYATDTLDDRRFRLLSRYNENLPYTRRALKQILDTLCGADGYSLVFDTGSFTVRVRVALTVKKQEAEVYKFLERVLPYNMMFTVTLMYNRHEMLSRFTHARLSDFTHEQLRSEILPTYNQHELLLSFTHAGLSDFTNEQLRNEVMTNV